MPTPNLHSCPCGKLGAILQLENFITSNILPMQLCIVGLGIRYFHKETDPGWGVTCRFSEVFHSSHSSQWWHLTASSCWMLQSSDCVTEFSSNDLRVKLRSG